MSAPGCSRSPIASASIRARQLGRAPRPVEQLAETASTGGIPEPADDELRAPRSEALAPKQRAAVTYHHLAGLPYAEVGELLGCSAAAARRSAADGLARLRSMYSLHPPKGR